MAAPFACPAPAWAEVYDKMGPRTFNPLSILVLALLFLVWLVGLAERRLWLSLSSAAFLITAGWLYLADRFALAQGDNDPSPAPYASAIAEGCCRASLGPGWLLLGTGLVLALVAVADRLRSPRS